MQLKLGKNQVRLDRRTLRLTSIFRELPPIPDKYDCDSQFNFPIEDTMDGNDRWGNCVVVARAKNTRRFESLEQKKQFDIPEIYILKEYWKEGGRNPIKPYPDCGLVMLDSERAWRKGWKICRDTYSIYAFGFIDPKIEEDVKSTIYLLNGINLGFELPISALGQFQRGETWTVVDGNEGLAGSWGGHAIYMKRYDKDLYYGLTWGKEQPMTKEFFLKYCSEAYGNVDDKDKFLTGSGIDIEKLGNYLLAVSHVREGGELPTKFR